MYSEQAIALFAAIKHAFDPANLLNPGVLVDPAPVDAGLRVEPFPGGRSLFAFSDDNGDFARAVHRCTGVGRCRADNSAAGGVMCPSYLATGEELASTRGRARVLQEAIRGSVLTWRSPELLDALDLCLSCKGCASDCPAGIDMATYKSEVLYRNFRWRLRPRSHYSLGRLPRWIRLASGVPLLANGLLVVPGLKWAAGVDRRRSLPRFARVSFRRWFARRGVPGSGRPVLVFADSFSNAFSPSAARAVVEVLSAAGYQPTITSPQVCCGLTWITTGQLDAARRILRRSLPELAAAARAGIPIVGIEPSCTAVLRKDLVELLDDPDARAVAAATVTLAELLTRSTGWRPPDLSGITVIAQPHCHQHAVLGWQADEALLRRAGAEIRRLPGCCGLAGNFGVEAGHYEVSVAVAEQNLLPALDAAPGAIVLADGFSCRTQVADLRGRPALHLAELLVTGTCTTASSARS
jgi:Fe-S oxidoreductase